MLFDFKIFQGDSSLVATQSETRRPSILGMRHVSKSPVPGVCNWLTFSEGYKYGDVRPVSRVKPSLKKALATFEAGSAGASSHIDAHNAAIRQGVAT